MPDFPAFLLHVRNFESEFQLQATRIDLRGKSLFRAMLFTAKTAF
jgi:hypothetical protein